MLIICELLVALARRGIVSMFNTGQLAAPGKLKHLVVLYTLHKL